VVGEPWTGGLDWGDDDRKSYLVEQALRPNGGVVMLLPGQQLEGTTFTATGPIHLRSIDVKKLIFMSAQERVRLRSFVTDPAGWSGVRQCLAHGASDMLIPGSLEVSMQRGVFLLAILSALYGGVHALAWNAHFPSHIEQILWRCSAIIIAGGGFGVWLLLVTSDMETNPIFFIFYLLLVLSPLAYVFARIFLVTEAFISVRSLPVGAYNTVSWAQDFPHVG